MKENKIIDLAKKNETLDSLQEKLTKQLQELERKKALADRRDLFLRKRDALDGFLDHVRMDDSEGDFAKLNAKITFTFDNPKATGYNDKEAKFTVSIPDMVESYAVNLLSDINSAIEVIESELVAE